MSKLLVDEIGGNAAADTTIASGKKIAGTASQFKMTDVVQGDVLYGSAADTLSRLAPGTSGQYLQTAGAAANPTWATVAAVDNTPAWHVGMNSSTQAISDATATKVELDDVKFDTGFTWDTTNYKGTPGTAGKYLIGCFADLDYAAWGWGWVYLYKNGASQAFWGFQDNTPEDAEEGLTSVGGSTIIDLGATDYVEMFVYIDYYSGTGTIRQYDATQCVTYMSGMKLIGA